MNKFILGLFALSLSLTCLAVEESQLYCYDKSTPKTLLNIEDNLGGGDCDDAFNLLSVFSSDYGVCYKGSAKEIREMLADQPIEYTYYGNAYEVVAVLSPKDKKGDVIKFQNIDLDSPGKNRLVNIIGEISRCK